MNRCLMAFPFLSIAFPFLSVCTFLVFSPFALAQLLPDNTLGEENSVVTPNNIKGKDRIIIDGGAQRGANLFHSFQEFNIQQGRGVYFSNPDGVQNILTRVTGNKASQIFGTLGVDGKADLFFINPNGIIFGPEAKLDVQGSFFGATADSILFNNGFEFASSDPQAPPLLTVNVPIGLRLPENPGSILVEGLGHNINMSEYLETIFDGKEKGPRDGKEDRNLGLEVSQGQTLGLVGGDIFLRGGNLTSIGGRVELGSVHNGVVGIRKDQTLSYDPNLKFGQIQISKESSIDVSGNGRVEFQIQGEEIKVRDASIITGEIKGEGEGEGEKGGNSIIKASKSIKIEAGEYSELTLRLTSDKLPKQDFNFNKTYSAIILSTFGKRDVGELKVETESLTLQDGAFISTTTSGQGNAGNITVSARDIEMNGGGDGATLVTMTFAFAKGNAGNLTLKAAESLTLHDAIISTGSFGSAQGNTGKLTVSANAIEINAVASEGAGFFSERGSGKGKGGNLTVKAAESLTLVGNGFISTSTFGDGDAGNLTVSARDIEMSGTSRMAAQTGTRQTGGKGKGGTLMVKAAESLTLQDKAFISTDTKGDGDAGNLTVSARDIEMNSVFGLLAQTENKGNGGNLTVKAAESLTLVGNGVISTSAFGDGDAGNLTVSARDIEMSGKSRMVAQTGRRQTGGKGKGGTLMVKAAESLTLQDEAFISTTTFGDGDAGNLTVSARDIEMSSIFGSGVFAQTENKGNGGNLTVEVAESLTLQDGAIISTRSLGDGDAGNITISARDIEIIGTSPDGKYFSSLTAEGRAKGAAGSITINSNNIRLENQANLKAETQAGGEGSIIINNNKDLILRNKSKITTSAKGRATGGNITIKTENLVAPDNSDISADAEKASGGQVDITAAGIFGIKFRPEKTERSDITVTSEFDRDGEVNINTPDVDPSDGLVEFDDTIPDISNLLDQNPCRKGQNSKFIITGRGGLPPTLEDPFTPTHIWQGSETSVTPPKAITPSEQEFIEAQGWISNSQGIELITNPETATPTSPWLIPPNCKQLDAFEPPPYLLASSKGNIPTSTSEPLKVTIKQFNFEGNTKFSNQELQQQLTPYLNKPITFAQLIAARTAITKYYTKNNYITSGAFIPPQTMSDNGTVTLRVVEGKVGEINVNIQGRLNENYIKSRLEKATTAPLNQEKLVSALQLLQIDPLVKTISAELSSGVRPDTSRLDIRIETANPWQIETISNNGRAPSVGTFRRGVEVGHRNVTGIGDSLNALYTNTDGSDMVEVSYAIPVNSSNGRIELFYRHRDNKVVESPFERLDIESNSNTYKLSFSQPIMQTPWQTLTLGLSAIKRDSQTSILGENYPLSEGADENGETKLSILQLFQDYELRGKNQVLAFNSQLNVGLGILDATKNSSEPDSRFLYWRGQGQWVRELAKNTLLVVGADLQLSPFDLVPKEQFGLGGYRSVRAYRQDTRLTDNGALGTVELRLPLPWISGKNRLFQVVPFIDGGVAWNSDDEEVEGSKALAAAGVGLQVNLWEKINMRLDYGIPLVDVDSPDKTAQEEGFYFSFSTTPFSF